MKHQIRCPAVKNGVVCNHRITDVEIKGEATFFVRCPKCKVHSSVKVVDCQEQTEQSPKSENV